MRVHRFDSETSRYWGHDFTWAPYPGTEGRAGKVTGWLTPLPQAGDVLVLPGPNGGGSCYVVDTVRAFGNPTDMFTAEVHYERDSVCPRCASRTRFAQVPIPTVGERPGRTIPGERYCTNPDCEDYRDDRPERSPART